MQLRDFFLDIADVHEVQVEAKVYRRPGQVALQELKASLAKEARKVRVGEGAGTCHQLSSTSLC